MAEGTCEEEYTLDGQGHEKEVEVAIVSQAYAVTHPGAMVVESGLVKTGLPNFWSENTILYSKEYFSCQF